MQGIWNIANDNKPLCSIKCEKCVDQLSQCQVPKEHSAPWSPANSAGNEIQRWDSGVIVCCSDVDKILHFAYIESQVQRNCRTDLPNIDVTNQPSSEIDCAPFWIKTHNNFAEIS